MISVFIQDTGISPLQIVHRSLVASVRNVGVDWKSLRPCDQKVLVPPDAVSRLVSKHFSSKYAHSYVK